MEIAPSILSLNSNEIIKCLDILDKNFKYIHFDVMDGKFVSNTSFDSLTLKNISNVSNSIMDVHLMIEDPINHIDEYAKAGADIITFHYEAVNSDINESKKVIEKIHSFNIKAGISIKPDTDIKLIETLLSDVDLILIMSVEPGFGGQQFINSSLDKIKFLKNYKNNNNLNYIIEIDGGINDATAKLSKNAGADIAVVGSFLFNNNLLNNIEIIKKI